MVSLIPRTQAQAIHNSPTMQQSQYDDPDGQMKNWIDDQKKFITACKTVEDVQGWVESREDALAKLKRKNLVALERTAEVQGARIGNINLEERDDR